jgi:hypothetical protein
MKHIRNDYNTLYNSYLGRNTDFTQKALSATWAGASLLPYQLWEHGLVPLSEKLPRPWASPPSQAVDYNSPYAQKRRERPRDEQPRKFNSTAYAQTSEKNNLKRKLTNKLRKKLNN